MIICPWCGTAYSAFQPNCQNCGGPLQPIPAGTATPAASEEPPIPPEAPRPIPDSYAWKLMLKDGWVVAPFVFVILGVVFCVVGIALTLSIVAALVGLIFLPLGLVFLAAGGAILFWRYQIARKVVTVLREGESTLGQIIELRQNFSVRVNGRSPWVIGYEYGVNGQTHQGSVSTMNDPGEQMQVGKPARVLYLAAEPQWSSIYPHP